LFISFSQWLSGEYLRLLISSIQNMKRLLVSLAVIIISGISFLASAKSTYAAGPTIIKGYSINEPTIWKKIESPYVIADYLTINAKLTIEAGTVIKVKPGASISIMSHELIAKGSEDDKIVFTSWKDDSFGGDTNGDGDATSPASGDWPGLYLYKSDADIENVIFLYGTRSGNVSGALTINNSDNAIIKNNEIKYSGFCALYLMDSLPIIEGNAITNNSVGVVVYNNTTYKSPTMTNNIIEGNMMGAASSGGHSYSLNAQNNWWGDKSGPYYDTTWVNAEKNLDGKGNKVGDGVIFKPWLGSDPSKTREPVILVPGIAAAINPDIMIGGALPGNWTMMDHTYDGIIQSFKDMGYVENKDFFIAYYDWRNSNADSAKNYLKPLIQKANSLNGTSEVNIVAHSMGGLVARSYIEGSGYNNDVDNLIMLATPNKGSSDVYDAWEGGYIPKNWDNRLLMEAYKAHLKIKNKAPNDYKAIHDFMPSVGELMPRYNYTYPKNTPDSLMGYATMNEKNDFLDGLNNNIDLLNQRVKVSIIAGKDQPTVNTIPTVVSDDSNTDLWKDGKPDPIDPQKNDSSGDGEVMLSSAQIQSKFFDSLSFGHKEVVSQSEKIIAQRLDETLDNIVDSPQINDEMVVWFASPVNVEIKDPEGNIITSDNINNIPLAKYAGQSNPDGFKIFSIPNPKKGKYDVKITGNGNGEYHIGSDYADYTGMKNDSSSLVQGEIKLGEVKKYEVAYDPKNEAPVEDIKSVDTTPPTITASVTPVANANGWNNTDVKIHFAATDDSGIKAGSVTPNVTLSSEGQNQVATGEAEDNAGNKNSMTVGNINIDTTPPITTAEVTGTKGENDWYTSAVTLNFSATETLSGADQTFYTLDGGSAQNGNTLTISNDGTHQIKYHSTDKAGNIEIEKTITIKLDQAVPTVQITSPKNINYQNSGMLPITYVANDNQSAADKLVTKVFYDGNIIEKKQIDLSLEKLGTHTVAVTATDAAGNQARTEAKFTLTTNLNAMSANISHYFNLGLISKLSTRIVLEVKLKNIQEMIVLLNAFQSHWLPQWAKDKVIENLKQNINREINDLENQIQRDKNFARTIDSKIQTILVEDLERVKV